MSASPPLTPTPEKPSTLASLILLCLILGVLAVLGAGGYFVYQKFIAGPQNKPEVVDVTGHTQSIHQGIPAKPHSPSPDPDPPVKPVVPDVPVVTSDPHTPEPVAVTPVEPAPMVPNVTVPPIVPQETVAKVDGPVVDPKPSPAETDPDPVAKEEPIRSFAENAPEVAALKSEADRRINEAPAEFYSDSEKQTVRDGIRAAKSLTRVATLQYGSGSRQLGPSEIKRFKKALLSREAETLLSDPQAVLFLIGYADSTGTSEVNRTISRQRAEGVEAILTGFKVPNKCYSVGIGTTSLISEKEQGKNRAVEVWVVIP